jgi:N-acetylglucosaminyldiphosphoundecaprenol N-acetyl-beta-D-mannosaminyltransferase
MIASNALPSIKPVELAAALPQQRVMGVPIHAATMQQAVDLCDMAIRLRQPLVVGVVNAAKLVNMRRDSLLRDSVLQSDLILADGASVVWASRLLRRPLPERIAGIDLFEELLRLGNERSYSVYLLGASPQVLERVRQEIGTRFPNVRIAGARDGYFPAEASEEVAEEIRAARPDMLFLGITSPKKEVFLGSFGHLLDIPVCHGVGGSFDVLAGKVRRAPQSWQQLGMEWMYRVLQEPRRMWKRYLVTNTLFILMLAREFTPFRYV